MIRRATLVAGPMLAFLSLAGCNGETKEQNAALLEENQQLRTQLEQTTADRQAADDRANRQAEIARAAEQRAEQAATQAAAPVTYDAPASAPASNRPAAATSPTVHVVKEGETLSHIALKYYRNAGAWQPIYDANKQAIGPNANRLRVGTRLTIPSRG